jgi:hypothetical protein
VAAEHEWRVVEVEVEGHPTAQRTKAEKIGNTKSEGAVSEVSRCLSKKHLQKQLQAASTNNDRQIRKSNSSTSTKTTGQSAKGEREKNSQVYQKTQRRRLVLTCSKKYKNEIKRGQRAAMACSSQT